MVSDFLRLGAGAIIGFVLAQIVTYGKFLHSYYRRPKLLIRELCPFILSHTTEIASGEIAKEEIFGFQVENLGRSISQSVQFKIIRIKEVKNKRVIMDNSGPLHLYATNCTGSKMVDLLPGDRVTVELARWREDYSCILPSADGVGKYFEETNCDVTSMVFTVAAWDKDAYFATLDIIIENPGLAPGPRP